MLAFLSEECVVAACLSELLLSPSMALQVLHLAGGTELLHLQLPGEFEGCPGSREQA